MSKLEREPDRMNHEQKATHLGSRSEAFQLNPTCICLNFTNQWKRGDMPAISPGNVTETKRLIANLDTISETSSFVTNCDCTLAEPMVAG